MNQTTRPAAKSARRPAPPLPKPATRRLRVYAFDPNASLDLSSAKFSHATIALAWDDPAEEPVSIGPVNEYLEIIDYDPASEQVYAPLDLNAPEVLGPQGLTPTEGDPRFHQQMVFAVVMNTIKMFERALGRKVLWAPEWDPQTSAYRPTRKLRVYPHGLRQANAYYSRQKRALLFGYFKASDTAAGADWIFTALSHDIIVHETTHAILDGLHPRYGEPSTADSLAFHEAFADIAALFAHFQLYEAVYDFIERGGGALDESTLLSGLAGQFAKGTTGRPSLRDAIETKPDPQRLARAVEPHERGSILVAAVFDAFLSIYRARIADLLRLSGMKLGTGEYLHPDLIGRLTKEATKSADHVLRMCIRALDYLPPVDVRFGEFLRGIITADTDLIADDRLNYRLAFIEAFRKRGIVPDNCRSMSPENLLWNPPAHLPETVDTTFLESLNLVPRYKRLDIIAHAETARRKVWYWLTQPEYRVANVTLQASLAPFLSQAREVFAASDDAAAGARFLKEHRNYLLSLGGQNKDLNAALAELGKDKTHFERWITFLELLSSCGPPLMRDPSVDRAWEEALGIYFQPPADRPLHTIARKRAGLPVEVHSVRTTRRAGPDGQDIRQLVLEIAQRRRGFLKVATQEAQDAGKGDDRAPDFWFRGGATVIIDLRDGAIRYAIRKSIGDDERLARQREFLGQAQGTSFTYDRGRTEEPFALLHRC